MVKTARKVWLLTEDDLFIPAIQVHQEECQYRPGHCCKWELLRQTHLQSNDMKTARKAATDLALRLGVPFS